MALGYSWTNIASRSVSRGAATVTFWIDVKLNSQNTSGNYSVVDTRLNSTIVNSLAGSGYSFSLTGSSGISGSSVWTFENETILTGQTTIYHNDDGTKTSLASATAFNNYWNINESFSGSFELPTIPRASTPTIGTQGTNNPNFNIGSTIRIYTNKKAENFTHKIYFNYGNTSLEIATGVVDYYDYDTSSIASTLYNLIPNDNSYTGTISLKTYNGTTQIGSTKSCEYIANVVNSNPIFTNFEFEDSNATTAALTGNNQDCISGYSNIKAIVSTTNKATAQNGATMSMYRLVIGNSSIDILYSSSESVNGTINKAVNGTYTVYAIDSRGNSTAVIKQANTVINYEPLVRTTNPSSQRNTGVGEEYTLQYAGTIWNQSFGTETNSITSATYKFKKTTDANWTPGSTNIMPTTSGSTFSFSGLIQGDTASGFDISDSYNIELTVEDELSSVQYDVVLINGKPNIAIAKDGVSINAKYDGTLGGALQVNGAIYIGGEELRASPNIYINYNSNTGVEYKTGRKIDGKDEYIYCQYQSSLPDTSQGTYPTPILMSDIDLVTEIGGVGYRSSTQTWIPLNASRTTPSAIIGLLGATSGDYFAFLVETGVDRTNMEGYFYIKYTKN